MPAPAHGSRRPYRHSGSLLATIKQIGFVGDGEDLLSEHYLRFNYSPSSSVTSSATGVYSRGGFALISKTDCHMSSKNTVSLLASFCNSFESDRRQHTS